MLSEFKKISEYPTLETPVTIRLGFYKKGALQYISHLDLQRVMSRILVRSGIPVWYTQGFNPHAKMVFSMPLAVGTQSVCEYLDIRVDKEISNEEILARLNAEVTDDMKFEAAYVPETKLSDIALVRYEIDIDTNASDKTLADRAQKLLTKGPLMMTKRSKSGDREVDILEYFRGVEVTSGDTLKILVTLKGGEGSLNPEMIVTALRENLGILKTDEESYTVMRTGVYFADGREFR